MQVLTRLRMGAALVFALCGCRSRAAESGPYSQTAIMTARSWLSAVQAGDSLAIDSLSVPTEGVNSAQYVLGAGPGFAARFTSPSSTYSVVRSDSDSAVVEVRASGDIRTAIAVRLARQAARWKVVDAAQLRRD